MSYKLGFLESASKEWDKLAHSTREQFKKKLKERLENPHVPASKLSGSRNRYKIKLHSVGYRLVYEVRDDVFVVVVIAVRKRLVCDEEKTRFEVKLGKLAKAKPMKGDADGTNNR